jgi:superfamily II RNA helicase
MVTMLKTAKKTQVVPVDIDKIADLVRIYDKLTDEINEAVAHQKRIAAQIKLEMGDGTQARVAGVPVFTYNNKNTWRVNDILTDHGHLAEQYIVKVEKEVFDVQTFVKHHPGIAAGYQVREFRRVSGIKGI